MISRESVLIVGVIFGLIGVFSDKLSDGMVIAFCVVGLALILITYIDFWIDLIKGWLKKHE